MKLKQITLKRVPVGFQSAWPLRNVWFGYLLGEMVCELCVGIGSVSWVKDDPEPGREWEKRTIDCPVCKTKGKVAAVVQVPSGKGYQIWETNNYFTGENEHHYYPISPVFRDAFDLAEWMSKKIVISGDKLLSEATWHEAINDNNVDVVFQLYKDNIVFSDDY
jgi:hypothetical protein